MPEVADVTVKAKAETGEAESNVKRLSREVRESGKAGEAGRGGLLGFVSTFVGIEAGARVFDFLKDQLVESVHAAEDAEKTHALLANAIKATGNASGQSIEGLEDMALHLSSITTTSKEAVLSVEQIEVRSKIPKGLFSETTQEALDLSAALGTSATQSANTLAKALENPATAAGALRRAHVFLSEEQQKAIKWDIKHGETLAAQTVILNAVKSAYGGAAEAVGQTFAGKLQIMQNQLENTKEAIGNALLPVLSQLLSLITPLTAGLAGGLQAAFAGLANIIAGATPIINLIGQTFRQVADDVQELAAGFFGTLQPAFAAISAAFGGVSKSGEGVAAFFNQLQIAIGRVGVAIYPVAIQFGTQLAGAIKSAIPVVEGLISAFVTKVLPVFVQVGEAIGVIVGFVVTRLFPTFFALEGFIVSRLVPIFQAIVGVIVADLLPVVQSLVSAFVTGVLPGLQKVWGEISSKLVPALENLWDKISPALIPALQFAGTILKDTLVPAFQLLGWVLGNVVFPAIGIVIDIISFLITVIGDILGPIAQVIGGFFRLESAILGVIGNVLSRVGSFVSGVVAWFQQLPGKIQAAGVAMMQGFINGILSLAGSVAGALSSVIHNAINAIPGGTALAHLAGIPGYALGTSNASGGIALVGEGSEPELVVGPHLSALARGSGVYPLSQLGGGETHVHVTVVPPDIYLDGDKITMGVLRRTPNVVRFATGLRGTI